MIFSKRKEIESQVNKYYAENPAAEVCTLNTLSVLDGLGLLREGSLPEPEPTYRPPTIRDLLNGPIECEVLKLGEWKKQMLLAVDAARPVFYVANEVADLTGKWTDECRIPAEPELPPEKPEWELIDGVLFKGEWRVELTQIDDGTFWVQASWRDGFGRRFNRLNEAMRYVNNREDSDQ